MEKNQEIQLEEKANDKKCLMQLDLGAGNKPWLFTFIADQRNAKLNQCGES